MVCPQWDNINIISVVAAAVVVITVDAEIVVAIVIVAVVVVLVAVVVVAVVVKLLSSSSLLLLLFSLSLLMSLLLLLFSLSLLSLSWSSCCRCKRGNDKKGQSWKTDRRRVAIKIVFFYFWKLFGWLTRLFLSKWFYFPGVINAGRKNWSVFCCCLKFARTKCHVQVMLSLKVTPKRMVTEVVTLTIWTRCQWPRELPSSLAPKLSLYP